MKITLDRRSFLAWTSGFVLMPDVMTGSDFIVAKRSRYTELQAKLPKTELTTSLHKAFPGVPGETLQNEVNFANYNRVPFQEGKEIEFPECTGGGGLVTHFALSHGDQIWNTGIVVPELYITNGITAMLTSIIIAES